ncbi:DyP-type peroxidase [Auricularia subglabra TFB-10046 SS5]|nr:DyP-type peroxidase [Auricularia subglabra TFB-10046 SS5]
MDPIPAHAVNPAAVRGARKASLLKHVTSLPPPPSAAQVAATSLPTGDIQADILVGMHKNKQLFYFFAIKDVAKFKSHLASDIAPFVTSVKQLADVAAQPLVALNIAFSHTGLLTLGVSDSLGDRLFEGGQEKDAVQSFNESTAKWVSAFVSRSIDGVILLASDSTDLIDQQVSVIESTFGGSISRRHSLRASIRPGGEAGHEMFGFLDGISQPAIKGFSMAPLPGQNVVDAGVIIVGATNVGGSFLAFRQLEQMVPEFNKYLLDHAPAGRGSLQERADLLGARMVGRWKSGAPLDLAPTADDPALGTDPQRNNNFTFAHHGAQIQTDQSRCPFSAHIRKTRPRADLGDDKPNSIMRSGIPYGPEVTPEEIASGTTKHERGLAFVAYQAQLAKGFHFMQRDWANNTSFPPGKIPGEVGFDPIIGQAPGGGDRDVFGLNPHDTTAKLGVPQFVISHGGEYFFSPPISALGGRLSM